MIPTLNAFQLRALADAASSKRKPGGEPFYVVLEEGLHPTLKLVEGVRGVGSSVPLIEIDTREVETRPVVDSVVIGCEGDDHMLDLAKKYDAVFWSEAAVEKFVLPYYASKSLWEAAAVLDKISYYWYDRVPVDTNPPANGDAGDEPDARDGGAAWEEGDVAYALMHTPDSEWNTVSERGFIGSDLHLLVRNPSTGARVVRFSDLPDPPKGKRAGREGLARRTPVATDAA